jgi:hypothetical protein
MQFGNNSYCLYTLLTIPLEAREGKPAIQVSQHVYDFKTNIVYIPLATESDLDPLSLLVGLLLHLSAERDRTHDTIAELLVDHTLVGISVVLHNLVQSVYQWLARRHLERTSAVGEVHQLSLAQLGFGDLKDLGQFLQVFLVRRSVAVEHGGGGDFLATKVFSDGLEGEILGLLCVEEDAAVGSESGSGGLLCCTN